MIDLTEIERYKENNRLEAKKATGGLPKSIWESYSAFANASGGIILLGVEEDDEHFLHPVGLSSPEWFVQEFWEIINDRDKVSANILSDRNVRIEEIDGKRIIVIEVPAARLEQKPIYITKDPFSGTYRRIGEGDYKCMHVEVRSMLRMRENWKKEQEKSGKISGKFYESKT